MKPISRKKGALVIKGLLRNLEWIQGFRVAAVAFCMVSLGGGICRLRVLGFGFGV